MELFVLATSFKHWFRKAFNHYVRKALANGFTCFTTLVVTRKRRATQVSLLDAIRKYGVLFTPLLINWVMFI